MSDLISRQAAIDAFGLSEKTRKYGGDHSGYDTMMLYEIQDTLESLPSAQPERKKGEWIEDGYNNNKAVCSECGEPCGTYFMGKPRDNFCKWCGAEMVWRRYER